MRNGRPTAAERTEIRRLAADIRTAVSAYNDLRGTLERMRDTATDYTAERADAWHDSTTGRNYQEWADGVGELFDRLDGFELEDACERADELADGPVAD